jgi:hypothetical protein
MRADEIMVAEEVRLLFSNLAPHLTNLRDLTLLVRGVACVASQQDCEE